jgi:hypothetical protein
MLVSVAMAEAGTPLALRGRLGLAQEEVVEGHLLLVMTSTIPTHHFTFFSIPHMVVVGLAAALGC